MIDAIEKRVEFDAAPERVWRALTDGSELVQWFPDAGAFDMGPGANGEFVWADHGSYPAKVEAFEPPTYLAWRWTSNVKADAGTGSETLVEFRLRPRDGGGTTLELRESGFARDEDREANVGGWKQELGELAEFLAR